MKKRKMAKILELIAKLKTERDRYEGNAKMEAAALAMSYRENESLRKSVDYLEDQMKHMQTWIDNLTAYRPPTMTGFYAKEEMERSARAILSRDTSDVYPDPSLRSVDNEDDLP